MDFFLMRSYLLGFAPLWKSLWIFKIVVAVKFFCLFFCFCSLSALARLLPSACFWFPSAHTAPETAKSVESSTQKLDGGLESFKNRKYPLYWILLWILLIKISGCGWFFFAIFCQTEAAGGSQDHLVCLHPLTILKDQSHMRKVLLTLGTKMHISGHSWKQTAQ